MGVLIYAILINAWMCEDAYITFRTLDNFVSGHDLTWNPIERVQAYTHPLWLLLLAPAYWVTGEIYLTAITASLLLVIATAGVLHRCSFREIPGRGIVFILLLAGSRSFIDYSTSGLANPLLFFLLAIFVIRFVSTSKHSILEGSAQVGEPSRESENNTLILIGLLGSLIFMTRPDAILFVAPALAWSAYRARKQPSRRLLALLLIGVSPAAAWEAFSLFYYGVPLPNSAYAKLNTGIPQLDLVKQAGWYFWSSLRNDPLTLCTIAAGLTAAALMGTRERLIAGGVLLYLLYLFHIGGDFMGGRFFAAPFLISAFLICSRLRSRRSIGWGSLVAVGLILCSTVPTLIPPGESSFRRGHGVGDERAFYFADTALVNYRSDVPYPSHQYLSDGRQFRDSIDRVGVHRFVGFFGYAAGPNLTIIDRMGLTDPLLSRLPISNLKRWRIGHFERGLPQGYADAISGEANQIADPSLREYYAHLQFVTRGPLWSWKRFQEIVALNTGQYDDLLEQYLRH
jgi:arabinofuranosyltransferase